MTQKHLVLVTLVTFTFLQTVLGAEPRPVRVAVEVPKLNTELFRIPPIESIREMEAELFNSRLPEIRSFVIDTKYYGKIYDLFEDPEIDPRPDIIFPDMGSITLRLETGEVMKIAVHSIAAKGPLNFSVLGVRLTQNYSKWAKESVGDIAFETLIRRIYYAQTGHYTFTVRDGEKQLEKLK